MARWRSGPKVERVRHRSVIGVVALVAVIGGLVLPGCSDGRDAATATTSGSPTTAGTGGRSEGSDRPAVPEVRAGDLVTGPCPDRVVVAAPATVRCATLTVPERHGEPTGAQVRLPVAIVEPPAGLARPDPVLYLDGGPGGDGVGMAGVLAELPLAGSHTVVLIGQRGSELADPSFACPEAVAANRAQHEQVLGTPDATAEYQDAIRACFDRVAASGPAFDTYDSATSADDLEAARLALGYEEWNLYGISYGTRLALEVVRRHPHGVRSAVLDSVVPPEVDRFGTLAPNAHRAFRELAESCAADPVCGADHPDLLDRVDALYGELESRPVDATVAHPATGEPTTVRWDGDRVVRAAFNALYDSSLIPLLPVLLDSFERGEFDVATTTYLAVSDPATVGIAQGLYLAVECRERAPFTDLAALEAQRTAEPAWVRASVGGDESLAECRSWPVPPAHPSAADPVVTEVPLLVLAGRFDPVTPPEWGRALAAAQPHAWFEEFPAWGHAVSLQPCARDMAGWFLDDPTVAPDRSCVADLAPEPAWVPAS